MAGMYRPSGVKMELFHGSNQEIASITNSGLFGGVFASDAKAPARSHGDILYIVVSPRPLSDFELNYMIDGAFDVALEVSRGDERIAEAIMAMSRESNDADEAWEFQRLRGVVASKLGYTSVEMLDEHGTTWLCLPGCEITRYVE